MRRPQWHVQRPVGYRQYHVCDPIDWPTGRNTQTTGRSTPLENIQRHRCTNTHNNTYDCFSITVWKNNKITKLKTLIWEVNSCKKKQKKKTSGRTKNTCQKNKKTVLFLSAWMTTSYLSLFSWRMADCELCCVRLMNVLVNQNLWGHPLPSPLLLSHHLLCSAMNNTCNIMLKTSCGLSQTTLTLRAFMHE